MGLVTRRQLLSAAALGLVGLAVPGRAGALSINPRSSWGSSYPPKGPLPSEDVKFLIVHHSASHNGYSGADTPAILRSWYDFHTGPDKAWNDIAYNFVIDSDGGIWEARAGSLDGPVAGDATGGNQGYTQLVCVIGDFNTARPTQASLTSLVQLLAWLADRYDVPTSSGSEVTFTSRGSNRWPEGSTVTTPTITGHRTMSKTTCPGDNLFSYVAGGLTADVEATRGGASVTPSTATTTTTTTVATTTTSASTSTTAATTTTSPPSTTGSSTTTTHPPSTTTTNSLATTPISTFPATTIALAGEPTPPGGANPLLVGAGSLIALGSGLLIWRYNRLNR